MKEPSTLGSRLQLAMSEEDDIKAAQLAPEARTTEATISNWLNDKVQVDQVKGAVAIRVAKRLRVRVEWLLLNEGPMREEGVTAASASSGDPWPMLEELSVSQALMAKVLAETIPTVGRALVDSLAKLDPRLRNSEYVTTLLGTLRRELASQDATGLPGATNRARGSSGRKRR